MLVVIPRAGGAIEICYLQTRGMICSMLVVEMRGYIVKYLSTLWQLLQRRPEIPLS